MIRLFRTVTIVVVLAAGVARSNAQPPPVASSSQAALDEAKRLNQQVEKLYEEGKLQDAIAPAERALALREKALVPTHPNVAESLNNLAGIYQDQGAYAKAEPLYTRALGIREKTLGAPHPSVARTLSNLAVLCKDQGAYAKGSHSTYVRSVSSRRCSAPQALMHGYYGKLNQCVGRAEALRQAQLRMLRQPATAHPVSWAAFIPADDWRPLNASVFSPQRFTP